MPNPRICSIEGCGKRQAARGWCSAHYACWRERGDPNRISTPHGAPKRFLYEVVLRYDGDECVTWPYTHDGKGYGQIWYEGRMQTVSRIVCEIVQGAPPTPQHQAAHICGRGTMGCVTPAHLRWATRIENSADKLRHGTVNRGARNGAARLSEADVHEIRALKGRMSLTEIGAKFDIHPGHIKTIQRGRKWGWLPWKTEPNEETRQQATEPRKIKTDRRRCPAKRAKQGALRHFIFSSVLMHQGDECLLWPFGRHSKYPSIKVDGRRHSVHRLVCRLAHGPPPSNSYQAAHACGYSRCVNPRHLSWKTAVENEADKLAHGTHRRGTRNSRTKLTEDQVRSIRSMEGTMPPYKIARIFNVSERAVVLIHQRRNWAWLS